VLVSVPRRLHAPEGNGSILAAPALSETAHLLEANRQRLADPPGNILGRSWPDMRKQARETALAAARSYFAGKGEPLPECSSLSLLLAGHQPEFFHPGVWLKNFAISRLGRAHGIMPVNLVVDNDTLKSVTLRLPALPERADELPALAHLPFDQWTSDTPFEERTVKDESVWASFPQRVAEFSRKWPFAPMLPQFWNGVSLQQAYTPFLGERLAAARRGIERSWGCHNLELPVSALCQTEPFAWFACHLLAHLPRLHTIYNECVHDYRRLYGIRSHNHPVPDLAIDGDWLEVPLWAWRKGEGQRRRLFSRQRGNALELRAGKESWPSLPANEASGERAVREWRGLAESGYKVRSRALTNTLFARLFVGDLFIHGIGGGRYDELTDAIIRRFYGFEPPGYLILSGTLHLPLPASAANEGGLREQARQLRDLHWNPQRHLAAEARRDGRLANLAENKGVWIGRAAETSAERRERFHELRRLTDELRPSVLDQIERQAAVVRESERALETSSVLQRRDYAFCLYPEAQLRAFFGRV
jgi:hypothetical protein